MDATYGSVHIEMVFAFYSRFHSIYDLIFLNVALVCPVISRHLW